MVSSLTTRTRIKSLYAVLTALLTAAKASMENGYILGESEAVATDAGETVAFTCKNNETASIICFHNSERIGACHWAFEKCFIEDISKYRLSLSSTDGNKDMVITIPNVNEDSCGKYMCRKSTDRSRQYTSMLSVSMFDPLNYNASEPDGDGHVTLTTGKVNPVSAVTIQWQVIKNDSSDHVKLDEQNIYQDIISSNKTCNKDTVSNIVTGYQYHKYTGIWHPERQVRLHVKISFANETKQLTWTSSKVYIVKGEGLSVLVYVYVLCAIAGVVAVVVVGHFVYPYRAKVSEILPALYQRLNSRDSDTSVPVSSTSELQDETDNTSSTVNKTENVC